MLCDKSAWIIGNNEIGIGSKESCVGEGKVDPLAKIPPRQVDELGSAIEEFDPLCIIRSRFRGRRSGIDDGLSFSFEVESNIATAQRCLVNFDRNSVRSGLSRTRRDRNRVVPAPDGLSPGIGKGAGGNCPGIHLKTIKLHSVKVEDRAIVDAMIQNHIFEIGCLLGGQSEVGFEIVSDDRWEIGGRVGQIGDTEIGIVSESRIARLPVPSSGMSLCCPVGRKSISFFVVTPT